VTGKNNHNYAGPGAVVGVQGSNVTIGGGISVNGKGVSIGGPIVVDDDDTDEDDE
jgi:hypothetical protein